MKAVLIAHLFLFSLTYCKFKLPDGFIIKIKSKNSNIAVNIQQQKKKSSFQPAYSTSTLASTSASKSTSTSTSKSKVSGELYLIPTSGIATMFSSTSNYLTTKNATFEEFTSGKSGFNSFPILLVIFVVVIIGLFIFFHYSIKKSFQKIKKESKERQQPSIPERSKFEKKKKHERKRKNEEEKNVKINLLPRNTDIACISIKKSDSHTTQQLDFDDGCKYEISLNDFDTAIKIPLKPSYSHTTQQLNDGSDDNVFDIGDYNKHLKPNIFFGK